MNITEAKEQLIDPNKAIAVEDEYDKEFKEIVTKDKKALMFAISVLGLQERRLGYGEKG